MANDSINEDTSGIDLFDMQPISEMYPSKSSLPRCKPSSPYSATRVTKTKHRDFSPEGKLLAQHPNAGQTGQARPEGKNTKIRARHKADVRRGSKNLCTLALRFWGLSLFISLLCRFITSQLGTKQSQHKEAGTTRARRKIMLFVAGSNTIVCFAPVRHWQCCPILSLQVLLLILHQPWAFITSKNNPSRKWRNTTSSSLTGS